MLKRSYKACTDAAVQCACRAQHALTFHRLTITVCALQGPPLGGEPVDCGAMCMPGAAKGIQALVDDAASKGAQVRRLLLPLHCSRQSRVLPRRRGRPGLCG